MRGTREVINSTFVLLHEGQECYLEEDVKHSLDRQILDIQVL